MYPAFQSAKDIDPGKRVFIYGSRSAGRGLRTFLGHLGIPVTAFLDTWSAGNVDGLDVVPFDTYLKILRQPDDQILIAATFHQEIIATLSNHGIDRVWNAARHSLSIGDYPGQYMQLIRNGRMILD